MSLSSCFCQSSPCLQRPPENAVCSGHNCGTSSFCAAGSTLTSCVTAGYGQLVHIEFEDRNLYTCTDPNAAGSAAASIDVSHPQTDPRCVLVTNVQSALGLQQGVDSKTWKIINPCILIFTLVLLRVLVYVALRHKTSRV
ncbi:TPA: hypothetical protein ACH3X1_015407 [Trebouxia sp. C0004]